MPTLATVEKPPTVNKEIKRGQVYLADLCFALGHEQGGVRPCVILSNDIGNRFGPTVIVAVISSSTTKKKLPTHISLKAEECGLQRDSIVFLEQVKTIDKDRVMDLICTLNGSKMTEVDKALMISIGLTHMFNN